MNKKTALLTGCACILGVTGSALPASAMSLGYGRQSEHVLDLQERLHAIGYFQAGMTGFYGSVTTRAVKQFQKDHGLPVDGEADSATLSAVKSKVAAKNVVLGQLARIINAEARGESFQGKVAVGAVILNRVQSNSFPDSITQVIYQPRQFSAVHDGQFKLTPDASAFEAAKAALNGWDPSKGALFYYNPKIATSSWSKARPKTAVIGNHIFTK